MKLNWALGGLFLLSSPSWSQALPADMDAVKRNLSEEAVKLHLTYPGQSPGLPGVHFSSFMPGLYTGLDCPDILPKNMQYEVLFIAEDKPNIMNMHLPPAVHVVMVKYDGSKPKDQNPPIVQFKQETMKDVIHFANERVEFRYASGMKVAGLPIMPNVSDDSTVSAVKDSTQVNWVKKAELQINITPRIHIKSGFQQQETLGPLDMKKASEWERMTFHTNHTNVQLGTETNITSKVTLKAGVTYDQTPGSRAGGILTGVDIKVPNGGQIMVFTSYKTAINPGSPNFFAPVTGSNNGAGTGIMYRTPAGLELKGSVNGIGAGIPSVDAAVSIPFDLSPKR
ncbi:MAG TPA: hypothetical protein VNJ08_01390 [Bacteriovoracaceae bacterium]|nr:hypothetical protein [Bacteriovoracaceae bacterium]